MYMEAVKSGVPLMTIPQLKEQSRDDVIQDLQVHPETARLFAAYAQTVTVRGGTVEKHCETHIHWLWRWLEICSNLEPYALLQRSQSYKHAGAQDRIDMGESWGDYREDRRTALRLNPDAAENYIRAQKMLQQTKDPFRRKRLEAASRAQSGTSVQRDYIDQHSAGTVQQGLPKDVEQFLTRWCTIRTPPSTWWGRSPMPTSVIW